MIAQGQETRRKETKGKADNKINKTNDTPHPMQIYIPVYNNNYPNTKVHEADERKLSHAKQE